MITKEKTKELTHELINRAAKDMHEKMDKVLSSGAVNLDEYDPDFTLPRVILNGLLQDALYEWSYPSYWSSKMKAKFRRDAKNIYLSI